MGLRILFLHIIFLFSFLGIKAQVVLNNAFGFTNGIYKDFEEFRDNSPSILWPDVTSDLIVMEPVHKAKMANLKLLNNQKINQDDIWGFCVNGTPYIKVEKDSGSVMQEYAGLRLRGRVCFYEYEKTIIELVEVSAFNPMTNKPFRTANVKKEKTITKKIMLDFETGKSDYFTIANVRKWIDTDKKLSETMESTEPEKIKKQLFKFLQIFNDRNPVMMK